MSSRQLVDERLHTAAQNPFRGPHLPEPALDHRLESPLGRLAFEGKITPQEYKAGQAWHQIYLTYLASIGSPWPFAEAIDLEGRVTTGPVDIQMSNEQCKRIKDTYMRGIEILKKRGRRVFHAVNALAVYEDPQEIGADYRVARIGLAALAAEL